MIENGICIKWDNAVEYIEIDFDNIDELQVIDSTIEHWKETNEWVKYKTESKIKKIDDKLYSIEIEYIHGNNSHLKKEDVAWGRSEIIIDLSKESGHANWFGATKKDGSGRCKWKKLSNNLIITKSKKTTNQTVRNTKFRGAVLSSDGMCVISGETTHAVLDAAHIIPVSGSGNELVSNGITLRADLHRLFDAGYFIINPNGEVEIKKEISSKYSSMLKNKKIPDNTFKRVFKTLSKVQV